MAELVGIGPLPIEKEARSSYPTSKVVFGEAILDWSFEQHPRRVYSGVFYISADENPSYDVVLCTESAKKLEFSVKVARKSSVRSFPWFDLAPSSLHEPSRDPPVSPEHSQDPALRYSIRKPAPGFYQAQQPPDSLPQNRRSNIFGF
jgi:hypothetical protein